MLEIGLGHNSGAFKRERRSEAKKPIVQLEAASTSILDLSRDEIARRRQLEVFQLMNYANRTRRADLKLGPLSVRIEDRHHRLDVWGRARTHFGAADDLTTCVPDDDKANHLYKADDPDLRAVGMAEYLSYMGEDDVRNYEDEDHLPDTNGASDPEVVESLASPAGVYYSTASPEHHTNLERMKREAVPTGRPRR